MKSPAFGGGFSYFSDKKRKGKKINLSINYNFDRLEKVILF